jgi:Asp-tRNA(Asn)/Glu-tRNA(Gln) amidotransferase A subunit family amidase
VNPYLWPGLHGAFVADGFGELPSPVEVVNEPRLKYMRLAVKDVFAIDGMTCGAGNPQWLAQQSIAGETAPVVRMLLAEGCQWIGKTVTDELTYSLAGINVHYGTPVNPVDAERLSGGSSSGSAVAVAAGHADLALGTDCGGSIRLPASYCGLWGIRPSHGRVAGQGCFTLAHSFDTVGWFARDAGALGAALECLLHSRLAVSASRSVKLLVSEDVINLLDEPVQRAFEHWLLEQAIVYRRLPAGMLPLDSWAQALRTLQAAEIWQQHGAWVQRTTPQFGIDVAQRFAAAALISPEQVLAAAQLRSQAQSLLTQLLSDHHLLLLPPVPGVAPRLDASAQEVNDTRARSQKLLCLAGLAGLPQVVMPWQRIDGAPVGLSIMGSRFADEAVFETASLLHHQSIVQSSGKR